MGNSYLPLVISNGKGQRFYRADDAVRHVLARALDVESWTGQTDTHSVFFLLASIRNAFSTTVALQLCASRPGAIPQPTDSSASVVNDFIVHCIASRALIIGAYFIKARTTHFFADPWINFVVIPALWSAGPPTTMKGHMHHFWNALIKRFQTNGAAAHNQNDLREWLIRILRR